MATTFYASTMSRKVFVFAVIGVMALLSTLKTQHFVQIAPHSARRVTRRITLARK